MQPQLVAWVRTRPLWVWAAVGVLGALSLVYLLPLVLVPEAEFDESRLKAENDLRTTFVQAIGGAVLIFGTWRTLHINREGQITERFTRAIDQLGEEKLDVRLGGIYALERIARDSKSDRGPIIEVLTAFLREHARWNPDNEDTSAVTGRGEAGSGHEQRPRLRADFQAVVTVLGRNQWSQQHHFDLRDVDMRGADLVDAHLEGAALRRAQLEGVNLTGTHLEGTDLTRAHLKGVNLTCAHLEGAYLCGAHLEGAHLFAARLGGANLTGAHLEGANLTGAHMEGAELTGARLEGADLTGAHMEGADLTGAHLEGTFLMGAHFAGANLAVANLSNAHLKQADVSDADLEGATLTGARLEGVRGLTPAQVERVIGLSDAIGVPPGLLRS